ncbi:hypothetical protein ACWIE6_04050 [Paenibacillus taichungensis]|uniref:hypothetical protein n=1 Tax=Paenibacillus taichungensis TaxID=484184 RepID=UPI0035DF610D
MDTFLEQINELQELQKDLVSIHPLFADYYPVVVAFETLLYIYDYSSKTQQYEWVKTVPDDLNIPEGCLAAFRVHHMDERMCAVVTDAAFQNFEQKVYLFHEFVHCYVNEQYTDMGDRLEIKHKMEQIKRVTWELDYEFPYDNEMVVQRITSLLSALKRKDLLQVKEARVALFSSLSEEQGEYFNWLEWNEGYARYLENRIREKFGLEINHIGDTAPFNRLVFYECGSEYISLLVNEQPDLHTDLEQLFVRIQTERVQA